MLMEMLDAVRPSLKLADDFPAQAIPLDTVKQAAERSGLVASVNYRPSRQNKLIHQYRQMNVPQRQAFRQVIKEYDFVMPGLDEREKAGVAEAAYRYFNIRMWQEIFRGRIIVPAVSNFCRRAAILKRKIILNR